MTRISTDEFLAFCKPLEGEVIPTMAGRAKFTLRVTAEGLEFTVVSTRKNRIHKRKYIDDILDRFAQSGSFITGAYTDITYNASYTLALIDRYSKNQAT